MTTVSDDRMWAARPAISAILRVVARAAPIVAGLIIAYGIARAWLRPPDFWPQAFWWVSILAISGLSMFVVERLSRRLLPLSVLFSLSLAFPDQAPSRFRSALRAGNSRTALAQRSKLESNEGQADGRDQVAYVIALLSELAKHDRLTRGHVERVRAYTHLIGEEMKLSEDDLNKLQFSALLHDAGKIDIPSEILSKPAKLDAAEFELIKGHPAHGERWIAPLRPWLGEWLDATTQHHERYDGTGYPLGLTGKQMSLSSRIVAVADAYDVITATRSYKTAQSTTTARHELTSNAGTQFDPTVVRAFLNASVGQSSRVGVWAWALNIPILSIFSTPAVAAVAAGAVVVGTTAGAVGLLEVIEGPTPAPSEVATAAVESPSSFTFPDLAFTNTTIVVTTTAERSAAAIPSPSVPAFFPPPSLSLLFPPPATPPGSGNSTTTTATPGGAGAATTTTVGPGGTTTTTSPGSSTTTTTTSTPPTSTTTTVPDECDVQAAIDAPDGSLIGCDLSGVDLAGLDLSGVDLRNADLTGADLTNTNLADVDLRNAVLRDAVLVGANLVDSNLIGIDLTGADLTGAAADHVLLRGANLDNAILVNTTLTHTDLRYTSLVNADLTGADLRSVDLRESEADGAILRNAWIGLMNVRDASLEGANLLGAIGTPRNGDEADWDGATCPDGSTGNCF